MDLVVVADMEGPRPPRSSRISRLFPRRDFSLDVFVFNPEEYERQKALIGSVGYLAAREGEVLYER